MATAQRVKLFVQDQDASRVEADRTARLLACSALVNAKSNLLNVRYHFVKDIQPHLQSTDLPQEQRVVFQFMGLQQAQKVGEAINDLERLIVELSVIVDEACPKHSSDVS